MKIIIFEDNRASLLSPFSINHGTFEVRVGAFTNIERFRLLSEDIVLIVRHEIEELMKEKYPDFLVNPDMVEPGICINGNVIISDELLNVLYKTDLSYAYKNTLVSFDLKDKASLEDFNLKIHNSSLVTKEININRVEYLWDCYTLSSEYLLQDINLMNSSNQFILDSSCITNSVENISFGIDSEVKSGVILDATKGPIIIDDGVSIGNGTIVEGPVYIGKNSIISSGALLKSNVVIGPNCKVGGEVTNSIFHGYSNKVHDGFLGHSYIGEWVNIGAGSNNSNLKNNYSHVNFDLGTGSFNTEKQFLGVMIGDYCRLGIMTMINTGTYIGLGSNIFGSNFQNKFIGNFSWGRNEVVEFEKFIKTIENMKLRRSAKVTPAEYNFLKKLYI